MEETDKKTFLYNTLFYDRHGFFYEECKGYAKIIVPIGTIILAIMFTLTNLVYWEFLSSLLNIVTGTSIFFWIYIALLIVLLDFEAENYNISIIWGVTLITLGIAAIYFSDKYRDHYSFECKTYLVDRENGYYHIDYDNKCEYINNTYTLIRKKGYEIEETNYRFCPWCKEWLEEDMGDDSDKYCRR